VDRFRYSKANVFEIRLLSVLRKSPTEIRVVVDQRYCPKKRKETVQAGRALPVGLKVTFLRFRLGRDAPDKAAWRTTVYLKFGDIAGQH
jgi:hypothetical protein